MKKVIFILSLFILLLCSVTSLHATKNKQSSWDNNDWKKFQKQNWSGKSSWKDFFSRVNSSWKHYNGYGYGHGYDKPGNGNGFGHGYDIGDGPGNGNGYGHGGTKPPGCNTPEPISSALFVLGGAGLGLYRKFKNKD